MMTPMNISRMRRNLPCVKRYVLQVKFLLILEMFIGSDLMKIVFKIKEDDARNPGVIADCTGDNAGDSVGPSADGFETYGVTGVALITFIVLAVTSPLVQVQLLVWIFIMRIMMIVSSGMSYLINKAFVRAHNF